MRTPVVRCLVAAAVVVGVVSPAVPAAAAIAPSAIDGNWELVIVQARTRIVMDRVNLSLLDFHGYLSGTWVETSCPNPYWSLENDGAGTGTYEVKGWVGPTTLKVLGSSITVPAGTFFIENEITGDTYYGGLGVPPRGGPSYGLGFSDSWQKWAGGPMWQSHDLYLISDGASYVFEHPSYYATIVDSYRERGVPTLRGVPTTVCKPLPLGIPPLS